ncbi:hypothetical protein BVX98_05510 [bacterium F11]|nr:hypothetical protein BVX98_05510 [bacterium F11]
MNKIILILMSFILSLSPLITIAEDSLNTYTNTKHGIAFDYPSDIELSGSLGAIPLNESDFISLNDYSGGGSIINVEEVDGEVDFKVLQSNGVRYCSAGSHENTRYCRIKKKSKIETDHDLIGWKFQLERVYESNGKVKSVNSIEEPIYIFDVSNNDLPLTLLIRSEQPWNNDGRPSIEEETLKSVISSLRRKL